MLSIQNHLNRFCGVVGVLCFGLLGCGGGAAVEDPAGAEAAGVGVFDPNSTLYSYTVKNIDGRSVALSRYRGRVLLVVNVASECRFTGQYANLQRLYMKYRDQGFVVLGFPSNDFGNQEPGSDAEIKAFTASQFRILFPLFSKISVAGEDMHPLYQCLTSPRTNERFDGPITWNFNKFLIDKEGHTIARFGSEIDPLDPRVTAAIEAALH
jgi:glutathione peroxidase